LVYVFEEFADIELLLFFWSGRAGEREEFAAENYLNYAVLCYKGG